MTNIYYLVTSVVRDLKRLSRMVLTQSFMWLQSGYWQGLQSVIRRFKWSWKTCYWDGSLTRLSAEALVSHMLLTGTSVTGHVDLSVGCLCVLMAWHLTSLWERESTKEASMPLWPHLQNHTLSLLLYHIHYKRASNPNYIQGEGN